MRKKIYINLITVFLLLFQTDILFSQTNNKIIITVGKYPITYFDLFKEVKMISILSNSEINENNREQIKKLAIASLIKRKIKISEIEKLGIKNYSKRDLEQLIQNTSRGIGLDKNDFEGPCEVLDHYLELLRAKYDLRNTLISLRKFTSWLVYGYPGAAAFRSAMYHLFTIDELIQSTRVFFERVAHLPQPKFEPSESFMASGHG